MKSSRKKSPNPLFQRGTTGQAAHWRGFCADGRVTHLVWGFGYILARHENVESSQWLPTAMMRLPVVLSLLFFPQKFLTNYYGRDVARLFSELKTAN